MMPEKQENRKSEDVIQEADEVTRRILDGLLRVERRYIHMRKGPRHGIVEELRDVVEREITA